MATCSVDQNRVRTLAVKYPNNVIPAFGYHPWFSHSISLACVVEKETHYRELLLGSNAVADPEFEELLPFLPDPIPLHSVLSELRQNLSALPDAMLGEVGVDRSFRIPFEESHSSRRLTKFTVPINHQLSVLEAQLGVAVELGRNVSLHSVKAQMITVDLLERMSQKYGDKWTNINIDLHSCGFSPQTWKSLEKTHSNVFLSLSTLINGRTPNHKALISACSPSRILVESDFHHIERCAELTWSMLLTIADIKGWHVEQDWVDDLEQSKWGAVRRLEENWRSFRRSRS